MRRGLWRGAWAASGVVWACVALGCGEDASGLGPEVGLVDVMCAPSLSEDFEGDVVSRIEAPVSDPDGDLARVTVTVNGAVLIMEEIEAGRYLYVPPSSGSSFIRCEPGLRVLVRATDAAGNDGEQEVQVR